MKVRDGQAAPRRRSHPNLTESQAREMLGRLAKSGQSVAAFARCEHVSTQCVHYWRLKFRGITPDAPVSSAKAPPAFIQLVPMPDAARAQTILPTHPPPSIELYTATGSRLSIPADFCESSLRRLLLVLGELR